MRGEQRDVMCRWLATVASRKGRMPRGEEDTTLHTRGTPSSTAPEDADGTGSASTPSKARMPTA